jgi:UDP-GlcNAc:undecaprenyl-phosphate GlcNAc-1-phosphate transferase
MNNTLLLITFFNIFLIIFSKKISNIYNLFDIPDFKRKIHRYPVPLLGGLFVILNFLLIILINKFFFTIFYIDFFQTNYHLILFLISCLLFFLIGFFDDKYNLSANLKLLLMTILILFLIFFDDNLLLKNISLSFFKNKIDLGRFSYFLTLLCFLLFINAFNMLDGINGQSCSYLIFIFIILAFHKVLVLFSIAMIIILCFFLILNFSNKSYLGDSGSVLLGYIVSYIFVKNYNININKVFFTDEIFLIMSIPGYELLRLAFKRIVEKKHPFKGDKHHIHHLLAKTFDMKIVYTIVQLLLIFPYSLYLLTKSFFISFTTSVLLYSFFIYRFSKKKVSIN